MSTSPWVAVDATTIPATRARELRDAWEDFHADAQVSDAGAGTPPVRAPIADSWLRSRDAGVDPSGRQAAPSLIELQDVRELWHDHPLARAAAVVDQCVADAALELDHLMVISDADGLLLSVRGEPGLRGRAADEMNFVEGALWSESGAGTNAVGTAVAARHAVQVFAAEHFTESVQRWTCAAAPIYDPDDGALLGIIDITGDISGVHPHSLGVVVATARAVEGFLRERMHARDERLRRRFGDRLGTIAGPSALVTATGRVLLGAGAGALRPLVIPSGGGRVTLASGVPAVAEPIGDEQAYLVRPLATTSRPVPHGLVLKVLAGAGTEAALDGRVLRLRRRHVELLTLLALRRGPASADVLCADLYGDDGHPASVRVEMSRLRKLLGDAIAPDHYRLVCDVDCDYTRVRSLLARNAVREAAEAYPGPLLPESNAPGIERERAELEGWLRQAVLTSADADTLWAWVQSPSGEVDLLAWSKLLSELDYADPRRSHVAAHTSALRRSLK